MGLFDKFKEVTRKVSEVENNIYHEKRDYLEIYERNLELEKEIAERTEELNDANKRMFTLQHIWDMMNSSTPLENVMEAIVNSTQGELGYMHCCIIRKCIDDEGTYLQILAQSNDGLIDSDKIYDKFSKYVNNKQDKKLVKEASEIDLPDEMLG